MFWGLIGDLLGTSWGLIGDTNYLLGTYWGLIGDLLGTYWGPIGAPIGETTLYFGDLLGE